MNRIETAASTYTPDLTPLEYNASDVSISCTPAVFIATLIGTAAGAAICYKIVHGFDAGTPDAFGEVEEHAMQVGDLLSARKAAIANIA